MTTIGAGLRRLHQLHLRLKDVQDRLERGPKQVQARRQFAEKKKAESDALQEQLKQLRMAADQKSLQLKSNESKIAQLRIKLNQASSNREFDIIKSQIDADTMANSVLEDEILEAYEKVDRMQAAIQEARQQHATAQEEERRVESEVAAARPDLESRLGSLREQIAEAEQVLPAQAAEVYRRLVHAHGAGALAPVENKACSACHAIVRSNQLIELKMDKLIFCRSCGRLLYLPEGEG